MKTLWIQFRHKMNRAHPNFGLKTKIGYEEWWRRVVIGKHLMLMFACRECELKTHTSGFIYYVNSSFENQKSFFFHDLVI
jgi:hypothetical protein